MDNVEDFIKSSTEASNCKELEVIQSLWSGYGKISRYQLEGSAIDTVIVKHIIFPSAFNHPRGWNTSISHQRKVKSYQVETAFYNNYNNLCNENCRTPKLIGSQNLGEEQVIVLEDLNAAGFTIRKNSLNLKQVKICIKWLANFHAKFLTVEPDNLWQIGTYWNLATRPEELQEMDNSVLKQSASAIDKLLNNCNFQTFVHGDAKVANFCFNKDLTDVAAVDFQYVGGGCGMKDVAYLMGSCLTGDECEHFEDHLLEYYFYELKLTLDKDGKYFYFNELESEWRNLFPVAWADFNRFLMGWMPAHQKINSYSKIKVEEALRTISS